jgi:hypothetical protein
VTCTGPSSTPCRPCTTRRSPGNPGAPDNACCRPAWPRSGHCNKRRPTCKPRRRPGRPRATGKSRPRSRRARDTFARSNRRPSGTPPPPGGNPGASRTSPSCTRRRSNPRRSRTALRRRHRSRSSRHRPRSQGRSTRQHGCRSARQRHTLLGSRTPACPSPRHRAGTGTNSSRRRSRRRFLPRGKRQPRNGPTRTLPSSSPPTPHRSCHSRRTRNPGVAGGRSARPRDGSRGPGW